MSQSISQQQINVIVSQSIEAAVRYFPVLMQRYFQENPPAAHIVEVQIDETSRGTIKLSDGTTIDLGKLRGPSGPAGLRGPQGPRGPRGQRGARGDGITSILSENGHVLIHWGDGAIAQFELPRGLDGEQGEPGDTGTGIAGFRRDGDYLYAEMTNGRSIELGNVRGAPGERGSVGERGRPGEIGPEGPRGVSGAVGPAGPAGRSVVQLFTSNHDDDAGAGESAGPIFRVQYDDGTVSDAGPIPIVPGPQGLPGETGAGISDISGSGDGNCTVTLTDGRSFDIGLPRGVAGPKGERGNGFYGARIVNGELYLGTSADDPLQAINVGRVVGRDGVTPDLAEIKLSEHAKEIISTLVAEGFAHANQDANATIDKSGNLSIRIAGNNFNLGSVRGRDGESFTDARINGAGNLLLYRTDSDNGMRHEIDLGNIKGRDGKDGEVGRAGDPGISGVGISDAYSDGDFLILIKTDGTQHKVGPFFVNPANKTRRRAR